MFYLGSSVTTTNPKPIMVSIMSHRTTRMKKRKEKSSRRNTTMNTYLKNKKKDGGMMILLLIVLFSSSILSIVDSVHSFHVTYKYLRTTTTTSTSTTSDIDMMMMKEESSRPLTPSASPSMGLLPMTLYSSSSFPLSMSSAANGDDNFSPIASSAVAGTTDPSLKQQQRQEQQQNSQQLLGQPTCFYTEIDVPTFTNYEEEEAGTGESSQKVGGEDQQQQQQQQQPRQEIVVVDLTLKIQQLIKDCQLKEGTVTLISKHTTTSLLINEYEKRLIDDIRDVFLTLIPPDDRSAITMRTAATTTTSSRSSSSVESDCDESGTDSNQETTSATTSVDVGAGVRYKHNDIDRRPDGEDERIRCLENGWMIDDPTELQRWRDQEPINAHSHLLAMAVGSQSECIPVSQGKLCIGQWQSIMLLDLDAPRQRKVGVHVMGYQ